MKTIIAGSRSITDYKKVVEAVFNSKFEISEVVSGGARGVDKLGEKYAYHFQLPIKGFIPDWDKFGKSGGYKRNMEMANYAEALIAIWDGVSKGTGHMIDIAKDKNLKIHIERA